MINSIESIYKILFLIFSITWSGNILLFRSERQVIINPVLIIIASLLVFLPNTNGVLFGIEIDETTSPSLIYIFIYIFDKNKCIKSINLYILIDVDQ